jgi:bifunctional DNA-binding transcriptional regulator/antitoxin component of YhaV-PrlF toxin-antitoxin module
MNIPSSTLSGKKQITVPAEVCRKMNLAPKAKILFLEIRPGEFQLVAGAPKTGKKVWAENLAGKYRDDSIDGVQSLLDDRKEDLELEERGYLK